MSVTRIASRYAKSLIDLAVDGNKLDRVLEDVHSFQEVLKHRDFYLLMKSPIVNNSKKKEIVKELFEGKYDELTMAFLNILISKNREVYLPEIADEFISQYRRIKHISKVKLTTASKLSDKAFEAIKKRLIESSVTDENVEITTKVDPDLVGGFILEFDDKIYNASIRHKLDQLKKEFAENLYISQIIAS